jgi:hypothetical protein
MLKYLAVAVIAAAGLLVSPATARADDQGYLNELQADGVFMSNQNMWVINGHRMCDMIHSGTAPEMLYNQFGPFQNAQGPQIVTAAQRNICPDTLH